MPKTTLISPAELSAHPEWRVFDCRHDLGASEAGQQQYLEAHIPLSLHAHLDQDLSGVVTGTNGRHPLPDPDDFAVWLGQCGLKPKDQIVAYDAGNGMFAARLWWLLRWAGHTSVAVLDGGLTRWVKEGYPLTKEVPVFTETVYPVNVNTALTVSVEDVERNLQQHEFLVLDARAASRYEGIGETIDPKAGHIPEAANRAFMLNVGEDGTFLPPEVLEAQFRQIPQWTASNAIVHQCGSGVSACHNVLAMEVAGLKGSRLYPGSWSEWVSRESRPVETGPQKP